jgi:nicotinate dehydrogenase subunit A
MLDITVNGHLHRVHADPETPLLYVLRNDLGLVGAKFGCGVGQCGSCTVIINDRAVLSCVTPLAAVNGQAVLTVEGLGSAEDPSLLQQAFIDEQAAQCGYCITGMVMRAHVLLAVNPEPDEVEIREAMSANLCRCGSYGRILRAVRRAANASAETRGTAQ